jgi:hypothetical protein
VYRFLRNGSVKNCEDDEVPGMFQGIAATEAGDHTTAYKRVVGDTTRVFFSCERRSFGQTARYPQKRRTLFSHNNTRLAVSGAHADFGRRVTFGRRRRRSARIAVPRSPCTKNEWPPGRSTSQPGAQHVRRPRTEGERKEEKGKDEGDLGRNRNRTGNEQRDGRDDGGRRRTARRSIMPTPGYTVRRPGRLNSHRGRRPRPICPSGRRPPNLATHRPTLTHGRLPTSPCAERGRQSQPHR